MQAHGLLSAPELGPVADTVSLYNAVDATRPAAIGKRTLFLVVAPILLPMIPLIAIEVPLGDSHVSRTVGPNGPGEASAGH